MVAAVKALELMRPEWARDVTELREVLFGPALTAEERQAIATQLAALDPLPDVQEGDDGVEALPPPMMRACPRCGFLTGRYWRVRESNVAEAFEFHSPGSLHVADGALPCPGSLRTIEELA